MIPLWIISSNGKGTPSLHSSQSSNTKPEELYIEPNEYDFKHIDTARFGLSQCRKVINKLYTYYQEC
jgi:hypothetical protein